MITQEELKELLHYSPETGLFTWLVDKGSARQGCVAGHNDKSNGYIDIQINTRKYKAHRLAVFYIEGYWPDEVDHENHIRHDNRWLNLRKTNRAGNSKNLSISPRNKSGVIGVSIDRRLNKFRSTISVRGKNVTLGNFKDFFEACCSRKSAEHKYDFHENHGRQL